MSPKYWYEILKYHLTGKDVVNLEDRPRLPYTEATIMEIQRLSCVAPGGLDHKSQEDFELDGYHMPKG